MRPKEKMDLMDLSSKKMYILILLLMKVIRNMIPLLILSLAKIMNVVTCPKYK